MIRPQPVQSQQVGLYIHFPYCRRLCPYCDFNVAVGPFDGELYADAVIDELTVRGHAWIRSEGFSSVYFGGGTPSLWGAGPIRRVIDAVRALGGITADAEITVEANPEGLTEAVVAGLADGGVNRISLGAQSVDPTELRFLGRMHRAHDITAAWAAMRQGGIRTSVDLIYGLPDQTEDDVKRSLAALLALEPDHISAYSLTIEPGTNFAKRVANGRLDPATDDQQAALGALVDSTLAREGFPRYEVSSYAPVGAEALHNALYWSGSPYLGLGAGAHSYLAADDLRSAGRRENTRSVQVYVSDAERKVFAAERSEFLGWRQAVSERLIVAARVRWGVDLAELSALAGLGDRLTQALDPEIRQQIDRGWLETARSSIAPTVAGLAFADEIATRWLLALDRVELEGSG